MTPSTPAQGELREELKTIVYGVAIYTLRDNASAAIEPENAIDQFLALIATREKALREELEEEVRKARLTSARRLERKIARYRDGVVFYFNGEAVVPISEVLAELASEPNPPKQRKGGV
jgi:hypothetical protein